MQASSWEGNTSEQLELPKGLVGSCKARSLFHDAAGWLHPRRQPCIVW